MFLPPNVNDTLQILQNGQIVLLTTHGEDNRLHIDIILHLRVDTVAIASLETIPEPCKYCQC